MSTGSTFIDFLPLYVRTEDDIRQDMDADANMGLEQSDPDWVDTREGSFFNMVTQPFVIESARIHDFIATLPAIAFVQYAFGQYLDYHGEALNLPRNQATQATGVAVFQGNLEGEITAQTQISTVQTDPNVPPIYFQTTASGKINDVLDPPDTPTATVDSSGALPQGSRYYVVTAIDAMGETPPCPEVEVTVPAEDDGTGAISLTWPAGPDGTLGYRVYRGVNTGAQDEYFLTSVNGLLDNGLLTWTAGTPPTENTTGGGVQLPIIAVNPGATSNVDAKALTAMVTYNGDVTSVTNPQPVNNGQDVENDSDYKERLLEAQEGEGPGNQADYLRWAMAWPGVGMAQVLPLFNGPGTVGLVIMTSTGLPLADSVVSALQADMDPYPQGKGGGTAPIDHIVTVMTSESVPVDITAQVTFRSGYSYDGANNTQAIRPALMVVLQDYFTNVAVGETVYLDHIKALFFQVEGVLNVVVTEPTDDVTISAAAVPPQKAVLGTLTLI